ncbi:hypothetical protein PR003_g32437 [Phytophthora rubi]|uniref:Secreted protein n=1 Tax=Phytophthora rubi TaxID=129364 RepID=A0A6A3M6S1_9STRA|nr:hypothetical protein PR002_g12199 [Phytophthora rubi]KAE9027881.1 hypothetical protein PR001_g11862 [Phytophthora rubi]KAE9265509.1 hypothetical protein PR003_g32437 [Phytophthora rubi]
MIPHETQLFQLALVLIGAECTITNLTDCFTQTHPPCSCRPRKLRRYRECTANITVPKLLVKCSQCWDHFLAPVAIEQQFVVAKIQSFQLVLIHFHLLSKISPTTYVNNLSP